MEPQKSAKSCLSRLVIEINVQLSFLRANFPRKINFFFNSYYNYYQWTCFTSTCQNSSQKSFPAVANCLFQFHGINVWNWPFDAYGIYHGRDETGIFMNSILILMWPNNYVLTVTYVFLVHKWVTSMKLVRLMGKSIQLFDPDQYLVYERGRVHIGRTVVGPTVHVEQQ